MADQYRSILKATSIFGGTQIIQILVGLVRSKLVAVLIGTVGMGLNSLYISSITVFISVFGLGLNVSVVKDLSKAYDRQDNELYAKILITFKRLILISGVIGAIAIIAASPILSHWGFKDGDHVLSYAFLSLVLFFQLQQQGNTALLVSSRRIKDTAKCTLYGSIVSLLVAAPFFYFFRLDGIVPGLVFSYFGNYVVSWLFARKIKVERFEMTVKEQWQIARPLLGLGIALVVGGFVGELAHYLTNLSITRIGGDQGLRDLGLYSAGFAITLQVIQLVFSSMGSDYYPRLAACMDNRQRMNDTMNEQTEVVLLLSVPILSVFMLFSPIIVRLLLSEEFLPVTSFVRVMCLGMLVRAISYALGYASFAKGDKTVYLLVESLYGPVKSVILAFCMYYFWGLKGLAWSMVINQLLYYVVVLIVDKRRYGYSPSSSVRKITIASVIIMSLLLALSYIENLYVYYPISGLLSFVVSFYYIKILNTKTNLLGSIKSKIKK